MMEDLNAKVGKNSMGKFGVGVMTDNGERLCDFCSANGSS